MAALLALHALPGLLLPAARAPARAPAAVMQKRAKIADFSDLEREVLSYLGTLNATQLNDESAPSPLAYVELQKAGRPDIVEACMEYGGYLAVSKRLGVRIRPSAPPAPPPSGPVLAGDEPPELIVSLSSSAREEKLSARVDGPSVSSQSAVQRKPGASRPIADAVSPVAPVRTAPLPLGEVSQTPTGAGPGVGRLLRLDGRQRLGLGALSTLLALGYGRGSVDVLPDDAANALRLAAAAVLLGHVVMGAYAAALAAGGPARAESGAGPGAPVFWFTKVALTGAGGLREARAELEGPLR